jgi:hypothetical protein
MTNETNTAGQAPELDNDSLDQVVGGAKSSIVIHEARQQEQGDKLMKNEQSAK